ncbi:hypothetical protein WA026_006552 [Henosepilachna vigintioctopunctata]|uniref:Uncharacterized protein n=1 Tax=Henosepilachna vigintioctopunctata TaxID=420089 RepID=A0AAW1UG09_9CUCU
MPNGISKKELQKITQEAVTRYTDTSWRIHRQNKNVKKPSITAKSNQKTERTLADPSSNESDGGDYSKLSIPKSNNQSKNDDVDSSEIRNRSSDNYAEIKTVRRLY